MLIVDSHQDLAWNILTFGRDYTRTAAETRRLEAGGDAPRRNDDSLLGWPDYRRGRVAAVIASLFAEPLRAVTDPLANQVYAEARQANAILHRQMDAYERLADEHPNHFRLVLDRRALEQVVEAWKKVDAEEPAAPITQSSGEDPKKQRAAAEAKREAQARAAEKKPGRNRPGQVTSEQDEQCRVYRHGESSWPGVISSRTARVMSSWRTRLSPTRMALAPARARRRNRRVSLVKH